MKVLRDHYDSKPTVLIDEWIINGCVKFKLENAAPILEEHNVSASQWKQVLDAYTGVSSLEEIEAYLNDSDFRVKVAIVQAGYFLDRLSTDDNWLVRLEVRCALAEQGRELERLIDDEHFTVREVVARQGYGLDRLVSDSNWPVRRAVAGKGYGLDILLNDSDSVVRAEVALQGYGLDQLVNDPSHIVREAAAKKMQK